MKRNPVLLSLLCLAAVLLGSCSGLPTPVTPPGAGTATVSVTFTDTPPAGVSILSFTVTLSGLALNPATGTAVNFTLTPNPLSVELTRLQSDSFLGSVLATVPSGTYNSMSVAVASSSIVFFNASGAAIGACANNTLCTVAPISAATLTITTAPFPLTLVNGQQTGIAIDFDLNKAISATMGVDFTAAGAATASALPHTGTPASTLDLVEDFTGTVTAFSSATNSLTVQSGTRGTLTGLVSATTLYHDPLATCAALDATCLHTGQTLSVNAGLNSDGTLAIREVDLLDSASVDVLEGTVYQVASPTSFRMVLSDKVVVTTSNTSLTGAKAGDQVNISWSAAPTFAVDTAGMPLAASFPANLALFTGGVDTSVLFPGQTVMVSVTGATTTSGVISATGTRVLLRHSHITATVNGSVAANSFNIDAAALPPYFGAAAWGTTTPQVNVFSNLTGYDGVAGVTSLAATNVVSIRALYIQNSTLNAVPMFFATKVRKQ